MGTLEVVCACGQKYTVAAAVRGKKVKCRVCQRAFIADEIPLVPLHEPLAPPDGGLVPLDDGLFPLDEPAPSIYDANRLSSFLDESLAAAPAPSPADFAAPSLARRSDPVELERTLIDAELADLKEELKDEFLIGHSIMKARGRLNERIAQEQAKAPLEQAGGLHGASFLLGALSGIGGIWIAMALSMFWPARRAKVSYGADEMASIDSLASSGRRRSVSAQSRSESLETLIRKKVSGFSRVTAQVGGSFCGAGVATLLLLVAAAMTLLNPLLGILVLGIALFSGFRVRREFVALEQALADYPHTAARFGQRLIPGPLVALAILMTTFLALATTGWLGYATYRWVSGIVDRITQPEPEPEPNAGAAPAVSQKPATDAPLLKNTQWGRYVRASQTTWQIAVPNKHNWSSYSGEPKKLRPGALSQRVSYNKVALEDFGSDVELIITETTLDDSANPQELDRLLQAEFEFATGGRPLKDVKGPRRLDESYAPAVAADYSAEDSVGQGLWVVVVVTPDRTRSYSVVASWIKNSRSEEKIDSLAAMMLTFRIDPPSSSKTP